MIPLYDLAVIAVAAGRVADSISGDEIFRPLRNWVYLRSAPVDDSIVTYGPSGDDVYPARMATLTSEPLSLGTEYEGMRGDVRTPGFFGRLISCRVCLSFWVTLFWLAIYLLSAHWALTLATPFAIWGGAVAFAHWSSR